MPCSRGPGTPGKLEGNQGIEDRGLRNTLHEVPFSHDVRVAVTLVVTQCHACCHTMLPGLSRFFVRGLFQNGEEKSYYGAISWPEMG